MSIDRDIRGSPRSRSLNLSLPISSSRSMSGVHLWANISDALAIGQNCP